MTAHRVMYPTVRDFIYARPLFTPNRLAGKCAVCGESVEAGKGCVLRLKGKQFRIAHRPVTTECPPERTPS